MYLEDKNQNPGVDPLAQARKNRGELIALLRDRSKWPDGFEWSYGSCTMCAMGLLIRHFDMSENYRPGKGDVYDEVLRRENGAIATLLGIDVDEAYVAFFIAETAINEDGTSNAVLPEHVAALLESAPYSLPIGERIALSSTTE